MDDKNINTFRQENQDWVWQVLINNIAAGQNLPMQLIKDPPEWNIDKITSCIYSFFTDNEKCLEFINDIDSLKPVSLDKEQLNDLLQQLESQCFIATPVNQHPLTLLIKQTSPYLSLHLLFKMLLLPNNLSHLEISALNCNFYVKQINGFSIFIGPVFSPNTTQEPYCPQIKKTFESIEQTISASCILQATSLEPLLSPENLKYRVEQTYTIFQYLCSLELAELYLSRSIIKQTAIFAVFCVQRESKIKQLKLIQCRIEREERQDHKQEEFYFWLNFDQEKIFVTKDKQNDKQNEDEFQQYGVVLKTQQKDEKNKLALNEIALKNRFNDLTLRTRQRFASMHRRMLSLITREAHKYIGAVIPKEQFNNISNDICHKLTHLFGSSYTMIYQYDTREEKLKNIGLYYKNKTKSEKELCRSFIHDMENITNNDKKYSICYRALNENETQLSEENTPLYHSPNTELKLKLKLELEDFKIKSALVTTIRFKGRQIGVIELTTPNSWRFYKGQKLQAMKAATSIAPFIFQQNYLSSLANIQQASVQFHKNNVIFNETDFYNVVSNELSKIFLVKGCSIWIKSPKNSGHYIQKSISSGMTRDKNTEIAIHNHGPIATAIKDCKANSKPFSIFKLDKLSKPHFDELTQQGIQSFIVIPCYNDKDNLTEAAIVLYTKSDNNERLLPDWVDIIQFIAQHLAFMINAINAFIIEESAVLDTFQHEIAHDVNYLHDSIQFLSKNKLGLKKEMETLVRYLEHPWFRGKLVSAELTGVWDKQSIEQIKNLTHSLNTHVQLPLEDTEIYLENIRSRSALLLNNTLSPEEKSLFIAINDNSIAKLITLNEEKKPRNVKKMINRLVTPNKLKVRKVYIDTDNVDKHWSIVERPTLLDTLVRNLIENAFKYNTGDKLTIVAKVNANNSLTLTIENEGHQLKKDETFSGLAQRSLRGKHAQKKHDGDGLGLGLYVVKKLAIHAFSCAPLTLKEMPSNKKGTSLFHVALTFYSISRDQ